MVSIACLPVSNCYSTLENGGIRLIRGLSKRASDAPCDFIAFKKQIEQRIEGYTVRELALTLNEKTNTLEVRLHRAKKLLKQSIERENSKT